MARTVGHARNLAAGRPRRGAVAAAVLVVVGLLLAGCDPGGPPAYRPWKEQAAVIPAVPAGTGNGVATQAPSAIVHTALAATGTASSVHVQGRLTADGVTTTLDMSYDQTGASGTVTRGGTTVRLIRIESQVWLAGDKAFWAAAGAVDGGTAFAGKYLELPATGSADAALTNLTRVGGLLDLLLRSTGPYAGGPTGTIDGQPAVAVADQTPGYGGLIWVATQGQPYLLRIDAANGSAVTGSITLTGYGLRTATQPPDPALVLTPAAVAAGVRAPSRFAATSPDTGGGPAGAGTGTPRGPSAAPAPSNAAGPSAAPTGTPRSPATPPGARPSADPDPSSGRTRPSDGG